MDRVSGCSDRCFLSRSAVRTPYATSPLILQNHQSADTSGDSVATLFRQRERTQRCRWQLCFCRFFKRPSAPSARNTRFNTPVETCAPPVIKDCVAGRTLVRSTVMSVDAASQFAQPRRVAGAVKLSRRSCGRRRRAAASQYTATPTKSRPFVPDQSPASRRAPSGHRACRASSCPAPSPRSP